MLAQVYETCEFAVHYNLSIEMLMPEMLDILYDL